MIHQVKKKSDHDRDGVWIHDVNYITLLIIINYYIIRFLLTFTFN